MVSVDGHRAFSDKQSAGLIVTHTSKDSILVSRVREYSIAMGCFLQTQLLVDKTPPDPLLDIREFLYFNDTT